MFEAERITGTQFEPNLLIEFLRPPFRKFEFSTPLSPERASAVLHEIVEPAKTLRWSISKDHRYFEGTVERERFKINRIISGQDSFRPTIEGLFRGEAGGSVVNLTMRM